MQGYSLEGVDRHQNSSKSIQNFVHLADLQQNSIHPDGEPSGYAKYRIIGFFFLIGYIGCFSFGCYYLQHVPASKPFDHA